MKCRHIKSSRINTAVLPKTENGVNSSMNPLNAFNSAYSRINSHGRVFILFYFFSLISVENVAVSGSLSGNKLNKKRERDSEIERKKERERDRMEWHTRNSAP